MTRLSDLELVLRTAELGSLTAAAKALDLSPAGASAAVKRLETHWGVSVFVRSTRSLRLSPEGERMLPHLRSAVQCIAQAREVSTSQRTALKGELQLTMPSDLGRNLLLPWLESFQQRHPQLGLRIHLSDHNVDLMRVPVNLAIRYGVPANSSLVALPLVPGNTRLLVAAPSYLARYGAPATADALHQHEALRYTLRGEVTKTWRLNIDGRWQDVPVNGTRSTNDGEVVKRWALAGLGLAYKSRLDVAKELACGSLVHVNPGWGGDHCPLYLVVPGRGQLSPAARALRVWLQRSIAAMLTTIPYSSTP